jgi:cyanophycinase
MVSVLTIFRSRQAKVVALTLFFSATLVLLAAGQGSEGKVPAEWIRPQGIDGALVIGGGGTVPEAALKRFVKAAGGERAKLLIVTDEAAAKTSSEALLKKWNELKPQSVVLLPARGVGASNTQPLTAALATATGVWIEDGDAATITAAFVGGPLEAELQKLLAREGAIGTSGDSASLFAAVTTTAKGLDLLPGAVIETHFGDAKRGERLKVAVAKRGGRVGYGIDDNTALVVQGRNIEVVGAGLVKVLLAAGQDRPAKAIEIKAGGKNDLTALRRSALARASEPFPPKALRTPEVPSGTLVIVGGGGNPPGLTERFIEFAGGPEAPIVVLPTAGNPEVAPNAGTAMFTKAGAKNVYALPSRYKKDVEDPKNLEILKKAKAVWFGGGRQWHFVDAYEGTKAYDLLHDVLKRGGVIGGSSAGATIQGEYLSRGGVFNNFDIIYEGYERAFAFLPGVVVDQHFTQRKRHPDMTTLMKTYPQLLGIGLDESTALIVRGHVADVTGKGTAHFYDYRTPPQGKVDFTAVLDGGQYDLKDRRVLALGKAPPDKK